LFLNNPEASEAITLKYILLDRGKANLDFDILQLHIYKKLTNVQILKYRDIRERRRPFLYIIGIKLSKFVNKPVEVHL
jgi:hypothetical protein